MAVLMNLDAVEHRPRRNPGALKAFGQLDMLMVARPFGQMRVERVAILPARDLVGEFRLARPRWVAHYLAQRAPFDIIAYCNSYPLIVARTRIAIVRLHHVVAVGPLAAVASVHEVVHVPFRRFADYGLAHARV